MTKLSYDIYLNGRKVKNVISYQEAQNIVAELGKGWTFKAVYEEFDPEDTPERRKILAEQAQKHAEKRAERVRAS